MYCCSDDIVSCILVERTFIVPIWGTSVWVLPHTYESVGGVFLIEYVRKRIAHIFALR
jgi:hypothetical protein